MMDRETRLIVDVIHTADSAKPDSERWDVIISDVDGQELDRAHYSNADNAWLQAFRYAGIEGNLSLKE